MAVPFQNVALALARRKLVFKIWGSVALSWATLGPSWGPLGPSWGALWGLLSRKGWKAKIVRKPAYN
eukprot:9502021-Pyramimonas_sp.AAC.1